MNFWLTFSKYSGFIFFFHVWIQHNLILMSLFIHCISLLDKALAIWLNMSFYRRKNTNRKNTCRCCGMRILKITIWSSPDTSVTDSSGYKSIFTVQENRFASILTSFPICKIHVIVLGFGVIIIVYFIYNESECTTVWKKYWNVVLQLRKENISLLYVWFVENEGGWTGQRKGREGR